MLLILTNESSSSKAAFLALRRAMAEGEEAHRGLTSELEEAIDATEKAVDSRFASMVGEWEKEVSNADPHPNANPTTAHNPDPDSNLPPNPATYPNPQPNPC